MAPGICSLKTMLRASATTAFAPSLAVLAVALAAGGCSAKRETGGDPSLDDPTPGGGLGGLDADLLGDSGGGIGAPVDAKGGACVGLECNKVPCGASGQTSISGTVYAPNGTMPLYNVIVYIPNAELAPLKSGAACDKCGAVTSGQPIVTTLTDYKGQFRLVDVPAGNDIPLVVQLGKWRRKVFLPPIKACQDNKLTDPNLTRLPKTRKEGDMPRIAVTTGNCDKLSCMLPKVGIDASEFGVSGQDKAVTFYSAGRSSGPSGMHDAKELWNNTAELKKYDMAVFSCECSEMRGGGFFGGGATKDDTSFRAVTEYLAQGGRIFTTDFQYTWYKFSPDSALQSIGSIPGGAPTGENPVTIDTTFPKGKALADWMKHVDPKLTYGQVRADYVFDNFHSANKSAQVWASSGGHPRFLTVNTPAGAKTEDQCGKAVHLDAHINQTDRIDTRYPAGCRAPILAGEEAFAFFFFDLSSCIQKEDEVPKPPPIK